MHKEKLDQSPKKARGIETEWTREKMTWRAGKCNVQKDVEGFENTLGRTEFGSG